MIRLGDATKEQVHYIAMNMRERDFQELRALSWFDTREEIAADLAERYGGRMFCFCFTYKDEPVAILAGIAMHKSLWNMGFFATDKISKIKKVVTKFCSREFFGGMRTAGAIRVECQSIVGYNEIHKWLLLLGFRQGQTLEKFGKDGQDFVTFEWVEGMPWPRGYTAELDGSRP